MTEGQRGVAHFNTLDLRQGKAYDLTGKTLRHRFTCMVANVKFRNGEIVSVERESIDELQAEVERLVWEKLGIRVGEGYVWIEGNRFPWEWEKCMVRYVLVSEESGLWYVEVDVYGDDDDEC